MSLCKTELELYIRQGQNIIQDILESVSLYSKINKKRKNKKKKNIKKALD